MKTTRNTFSSIIGAAAVMTAACCWTSQAAPIAPYTNDANTLLLDHFDGSSAGTIGGWRAGGACGPEWPSATPSYAYEAGPSGLGQALTLRAPAGEPAGSETLVKYPGGEILSIPNGTLEFWAYLTSYADGRYIVETFPYPGACAGNSFNFYVLPDGRLFVGAWASFDITPTNTVPLLTWTHIAVSWGSAGGKLYINGVLVGSDSTTAPPASGFGASLYVRMGYGDNSNRIDELRLSNIQRTKFNLGISLQPTFQWAIRAGATAYDDAHAVGTDAAGNVFVGGRFNGTVDFDPGPGTNLLSSLGNADAYVAKYSPTGSLLWAKRVGGSDVDLVYALAVGSDGAVVAAGGIQGYGNVDVDFDPGPGTYFLRDGAGFVWKLDAEGNFLWAIRTAGYAVGYGNTIALDSSGNVHLTGSFVGTVDFDPGPGVTNITVVGGSSGVNAYVAKFDSVGHFVWARRLGRGADAWGNGGVAVDAEGNVCASGLMAGSGDFGGVTLTSGGGHDAYAVKLDSAGNFAWAHNFGGSGDDGANCARVDTEGNVYLSGWFGNTVDFDPGLGRYDLASLGPNDGFLLKLDANGNFQWARQIGGSGSDSSFSDFALDPVGNVYASGRFQNTVQVDAGVTTNTITSAGNYDVFLMKCTTDGWLQWVVRMGGSDMDRDPNVAIDGTGSIYVGGIFRGTADFDPGTNSVNLTSAGGDDMFLVRLTEPPTISTVAPYVPDGNTLVLDHFDGSTAGTIGGWRAGGACGPEWPSATPSYAYEAGPNGLGQALTLRAPAGEPAGSETSVKYPGGEILSIPNGTLEFWAYLTSYADGRYIVETFPYPGACAGNSFNFYVLPDGRLFVGAWASFDITPTNTVPLFTWTHIAVSWGSAGGKLYINGVLVGSDPTTAPPASGFGASLYVRMGYGDNSNRIDELRLSNIQRTSFNLPTTLLLTNFTIAPANPVISTLQTVQFTATAIGDDGVSRVLSASDGLMWNSSNPSVATIDASGLATPTGQGYTTITVAKGSLSANTWLFVTNQPPTVVKAPVNQSVRPGSEASWCVAVEGSQPMTFQWRRNGEDIPGAAGNCLTISNASPETAGLYSLVVSNPFGTNTVQAALSLVDLKMFAGLVITGPAGHYRIDAMQILGGTNTWTILGTVNVTESPYYYFDTNSPDHRQRFYRAVWQP